MKIRMGGHSRQLISWPLPLFEMSVDYATEVFSQF
jgi:hypothetical protein